MSEKNFVTVIRYSQAGFIGLYIIGAIAIASVIAAGILIFVYSLTPQDYWFSSKANPGSTQNERNYIPDVTLYYTGAPIIHSGVPITGACITDITFGNCEEAGAIMRYNGTTQMCTPISSSIKATGSAYLAAAILATVGGFLMILALVCVGSVSRTKYQVWRESVSVYKY